MWVLLWTDGLFIALVVAVAIGIVLASRHEHYRRPWRTVQRSRSAMMSLVALIAFTGIALIDSIHFFPRQSGPDGREVIGSELISVLDAILPHLAQPREKTYSAPLAAYSFSREMVTLPSGEQAWQFPRLAFGGAHLANPAVDGSEDVLRRSGVGLVKGLILCGLSGLALWGWGRLGPGRARATGSEIHPAAQAVESSTDGRGAAYAALAALLVIGAVLLELSQVYHVFGTDKVGRDVFYLSLKSIRTGLVIGTLTTLFTLPLALILGVVAGYRRGWVDDVIQYVYTTLNSIPSVLLIAAAILITQAHMARHEEQFANLASRADLRLLFLCLILGITSWTGLCRVLRAETLKLRELDYVLAARTLGASTAAILTQHILPNVFHLVLINTALDFSGLVLAEAVLSYVNIGVDPTTPSWGNMINNARLELAREPAVWWSLTAAFSLMLVLVLAANLFADTLRDAFDPRRNA